MTLQGIVFLFLLAWLILFLYLKLAVRLKIVDLPNQRSSHTNPTLRGGGIVIPLLAIMAWLSFSSVFHYYLIVGLAIISAISFLDDRFTLSGAVRYPFHVLAAVFALLWWNHELATPLIWLVVAAFFLTAMMNAYNFMDGINGITVANGLAVWAFLGFYQQDWFHDAFFLSIGFSLAVFAFYNFRIKARCFAGDVGSVSLAFLLGSLLFYQVVSGRIEMLLLTTVFAVDSVITIMHRIRLRENIFEAHRHHLYQWLVDKARFSHLKVATVYAAIQVSLAFIPQFISHWGFYARLAITAVFYLLFVGVHQWARFKIKNTVSHATD